METPEQITLDMPFIEVVTPLEKVTLPGSKAEFVSNIQTTDSEKFEEYFKHQFLCFNVDASSAHACWPVFSNGTKPFVAALNPGLHTVEAVLTHPETRQGIEETQTEFRTFFTAGDDNESAAVVAQVEVDEVMYDIPVANGGNAETQGFFFCGSKGITDERCVTMVAQKIESEFLKAWEELEKEDVLEA